MAFLALTWPGDTFPDRLRAIIAATRVRGWRECDAREGFSFWVSPEQIVARCPVGDGWILGPFHRRRHGGGDARLDPLTAARLLSRMGFGSYTAIWPAAERWPLSVFRDPSGASEAATGELDGAVWLTDSPRLVRDLTSSSTARVRFDRIAHMLQDVVETAGEPALQGVTGPAPGELLQRRGDAVTRQAVWTPLAMAEQPIVGAGLDEGAWVEHARQLHELVGDVVETVARTEPAWLVEVSGGLDSSIVASAMTARASERVRAWVHYVGDSRESDERRFASATARAGAFELTEMVKHRPALTDEVVLETAGGLRPSLNGLDTDYAGALHALAATTGAGALMTGQGGDSVFWTRRTPLAALSLVAGRGWSSVLDPEIRAISIWAREPVWRVVRACRRALADAAARELMASRAVPLASPELRGAPPPRTHAWLKDLASASPDHRAQIEEFAACQLTWAATSRRLAVAEAHPLLSQPLLEFGLRTPAAAWLRGGIDRSLARQAFSDELAPEVRLRRGKGDLTAFYTRMLAQAVGWMRPFLLDGVLASRGLLDRARLEAVLNADALMWRGGAADLIHVLAIEAWVQRWS